MPELKMLVCNIEGEPSPYGDLCQQPRYEYTEDRIGLNNHESG